MIFASVIIFMIIVACLILILLRFFMFLEKQARKRRFDNLWDRAIAKPIPRDPFVDFAKAYIEIHMRSEERRLAVERYEREKA